MSIKVFPLLLLSLYSCTHSVEKKHISKAPEDIKKICTTHLSDLESYSSDTFIYRFQEGLGITGSILSTTGGFAGDLVILVGGYGMGLLICAPLGQYGGSQCTQVMWDGYSAYLKRMKYSGLGQYVFDSTAPWRCALDPISKAIRKTSSCYYEHNEFVTAYEQLNVLKEDQELQKCLSDGEKKLIEKQLESYAHRAGEASR